MFCLTASGSGIQVIIALTCTAHLNIGKHYPALDRLPQMAVAPPAAEPIMLKTAGEQLEKHGKGVDPA